MVTARGAIGKRRPIAGGQPKRKVPSTLSNDENVENQSLPKKPRNFGTDVHSVEPFSLHQTYFKCPLILTVLVVVGDIVILTFDQRYKSKLGSFLSDKGVDLSSCFVSERRTADGPRIALVAQVVENDPLVRQPWELMRFVEDKGFCGDGLYPDGSGLVVRIRANNGEHPATNEVTISCTDLSRSAKMDLWTDRAIDDYADLWKDYKAMDAQSRMEALVHMSKELDPFQQIWIAREYYK